MRCTTAQVRKGLTCGYSKDYLKAQDEEIKALLSPRFRNNAAKAP